MRCQMTPERHAKTQVFWDGHEPYLRTYIINRRCTDARRAGRIFTAVGSYGCKYTMPYQPLASASISFRSGA